MNKVAIITFIAGLAGGQALSSILSPDNDTQDLGVSLKHQELSSEIEQENEKLKTQVKQLQNPLRCLGSVDLASSERFTVSHSNSVSLMKKLLQLACF